MRRLLECAVVAIGLAACGSRSEPAARFDPDRPPVVVPQHSGVGALLQAVSVVDSNVVWISGHDATVVRTTDGGRTWTRRPVSAPDSLQFRDVHALDARTAWLLSAGPGDMSRIYRTDDGGSTWALQWTNPEPAGFYDCFDFWDANRGVAYGDAVDGGLRVLITDDGGRNWRLVPQSALPAAQPGEGGFAASGLCVQTGPGGLAWIAAGNAPRARVFMTGDYGRSWSAADVPVVSGVGSGLTAISMRDDDDGVAFGGNLAITDRPTDNVARTDDGGRTWTAAPHVSFDGAVYGGLHVRFGGGALLLAVGPGGLAAANAEGDRWVTLDAQSWWGIGTRTGQDATWIAGPNGRIARVVVGP